MKPWVQQVVSCVKEIPQREVRAGLFFFIIKNYRNYLIQNVMKEMLEQSPDLPCTRVVNDFRLYPFFTGTKKIAWFIHPKNSPFRFAFSTLKDAESFAKKYSNNHTDKF